MPLSVGSVWGSCVALSVSSEYFFEPSYLQSFAFHLPSLSTHSTSAVSSNRSQYIAQAAAILKGSLLTCTLPLNHLLTCRMLSYNTITFWGLFIAAAAQDVTTIANQSSASVPQAGGMIYGSHYSVILPTDQAPPYTVYDCDFAMEVFEEGWVRQEECTSLSTVTTLTCS